MSAHTPGPWFIGASLGIHTNNGMPYIANVPTGRGDKQREANARLIAAAPELLAFAKWAMGQLCGDSGTGESYWEQFQEFRKGKSAIAKAEGKT